MIYPLGVRLALRLSMTLACLSFTFAAPLRCLAATLSDHRLIDHLADGAISDHTLSYRAGYHMRQEIVCMALTLYHEARGVGHAEESLISHVVLNRTKQGQWGHSICTTVYAPHPTVGRPGRAFSWVQKHDRTPYDLTSWGQALDIASLTILHPNAPDPTHGANFYSLPSTRAAWSHGLRPVLRARHVYYRVPVLAQATTSYGARPIQEVAFAPVGHTRAFPRASRARAPAHTRLRQIHSFHRSSPRMAQRFHRASAAHRHR